MKYYRGGISVREGVKDTPLSEVDVAARVTQCSVSWLRAQLWSQIAWS